MVASVVPQLVTESQDLAGKIPSYAQRLRAGVDRWANNPPVLLRKFLGRENTAAAGTNEMSGTNFEANASLTNAPGVPAREAAPTSFWDQALDKTTLQTATGWVAKVLPKAGSWL